MILFPAQSLLVFQPCYMPWHAQGRPASVHCEMLWYFAMRFASSLVVIEHRTVLCCQAPLDATRGTVPAAIMTT